MRVEWHKLGEYIEVCNQRNADMRYGIDLIEGVNSEGEFCPPKACTEGIDLKPYKIVQPGDFVYNPSRVNIGSLSYRVDPMCIVSHLYVVFHLTEYGREWLLPEYVRLFLSRKEFGRLVTYRNFGSQRPEFNFKQMCEVEIPVPPIAEQRKVVEAWQGLRKMKEENEQLAEPLLALCRSYLQEIKKKYPMKEIGPMIILSDEVNEGGKNLPVVGVNFQKEFMPTAANMDGIDTSKYKVMKSGRFVFSGMQTGRDVCIRIGLWDSADESLVSPAYTTFELKHDCGVLPEYFFLMFKRSEMDRLGWFYSDSSVRSNLDWPRFEMIKIPLPPIEVQQAVVDLYRCANEAKKIAAEADKLSREICPALIQRVIKDGL